MDESGDGMSRPATHLGIRPTARSGGESGPPDGPLKNLRRPRRPRPRCLEGVRSIQRQTGVRGFTLLTARSEFHLSALSRSLPSKRLGVFPRLFAGEDVRSQSPAWQIIPTSIPDRLRSEPLAATLRNDFVLYDADTKTFSHRRIPGDACHGALVRDPEPLGRSLTGAEVPLGGARRRLMRHRQTYARKLRSFLAST